MLRRPSGDCATAVMIDTMSTTESHVPSPVLTCGVLEGGIVRLEPLTPEHVPGLQLAAEAADKVPDLPTLRSFRTVQPRRAVRAGLRAGLAVALAPAEGPFGESAEAFFSCSSSRPFET